MSLTLGRFLVCTEDLLPPAGARTWLRRKEFLLPRAKAKSAVGDAGRL